MLSEWAIRRICYRALPRQSMPISPTPETKKRKDKLRRYERLLAKEKAMYGAYDDSSGKRYALGPLYMLLGDVEGALKSFAWFDFEFPDDCGDMGQYVCWALALHRAGRIDEAERKLRQAMLLRPTVFARVFGQPWAALSVDEAGDAMDADEAEQISAEYMGIWSAVELAWAVDRYRGAEFMAVRDRYAEIERLLRHEPRGEKRTNLVDEMFALGRG